MMLSGLRRWDLKTASRVTPFRGDLGNDPRANRTVLPAREPGDPAARECQLLHARVPRVPRDDSYLVVSALVPYKRIDQAVAACTRIGPTV